MFPFCRFWVWQSEQNFASWQRVQFCEFAAAFIEWIEMKSDRCVLGLYSPRRDRLRVKSGSIPPPLWQSRQKDC